MKKIFISLCFCLIAALLAQESCATAAVSEGKRMQVAYLGPAGTFSHIIALRRFGSNAELVPEPSVAAIFDFLAKFPDAEAVVPIENSTAGPILSTVDLLIKNDESIRILEELSMDVRIALLGHLGEEIQTIYSHYVPLQHYRTWIASHFPAAQAIPVNSTAMAAKKAASERHSAALASPDAASLYGLSILQFPILPETLNVTRFFVMGGLEATAPSASPQRMAAIFQPKGTDDPRAILAIFSRRSIRTRLMVRRSQPNNPGKTVFFIESDGEKNSLKQAFQEASALCEKFGLLGFYSSRERYSSGGHEDEVAP